MLQKQEIKHVKKICKYLAILFGFILIEREKERTKKEREGGRKGGREGHEHCTKKKTQKQKNSNNSKI